MNKADQEIHDLKEDKKMLQSLERLLLNPDFKKVIMDGYLVKHPLALIQGKGRLLLDPQTNQDIDRQLDAVALFRMYLENQSARIADIDIKIVEAETLREREIQGNIQ